MKPSPEKNWNKLTCLIISIVLLTFVATSFLFVNLAVRAPAVILKIDWFNRIAYLELTKKLVFKKDIKGCVVYLYSERVSFSGKTIELANTEQLETIVGQAINDFPGFVSERHGLIIPKKEVKYLVMTLASEEHFRSYEILRGGPVNAFIMSGGHLKRIYFKASSLQFDITEHKSTIRHEIFHWIAFEYGLNYFLPHDIYSGDAHDFGRLR